MLNDFESLVIALFGATFFLLFSFMTQNVREIARARVIDRMGVMLALGFASILFFGMASATNELSMQELRTLPFASADNVIANASILIWLAVTVLFTFTYTRILNSVSDHLTKEVAATASAPGE